MDSDDFSGPVAEWDAEPRTLPWVCLAASLTSEGSLQAVKAALPGAARGCDTVLRGEVLLVRRRVSARAAFSAAALRAVGALVQASILATAGVRPWIGISRCWVQDDPPGEPGRDEAETAIELGKRLWSEPRVVLYDDVSVLQIVADDPEVVARLDAILEPLLAHDREWGTDLLGTLQVFLDADLSAVTTAKRLFVHRQTINHRVRTAERALGRSLHQSPDRLLVEMALFAHLLREREASGVVQVDKNLFEPEP